MNNFKFLILIMVCFFLCVDCYSQPQTEWVRLYASDSTQDDYPVNMVTEVKGNIYITGYTEINSSNYDIVTLKYNMSGNLEGKVLNYL